MNTLIQHFQELFTITGILALINIILIDIVMSGDNAILIGMATRKLESKDRKKAIFFGIFFATVLRIIFAFFAVFLLAQVGIKLAGGILLLYVVWKFYRELRTETSTEHHMQIKNTGLFAAVSTIIVADVSMSLDNVLAVAGAANENLVALGIGLIFSIILMAFASNLIAKYLDTYPQIQWVGLLVILFVAIEMILSGSTEVEKAIFHINILPFLLFVLGGVFVVLHTKFIQPANEEKLRQYLQNHMLSFYSSGIIFLVGMLFFGVPVLQYIQSHTAIFYSAVFVLFFCILEIISLARIRFEKKNIKK